MLKPLLLLNHTKAPKIFTGRKEVNSTKRRTANRRSLVSTLFAG